MSKKPIKKVKRELRKLQAQVRDLKKTVFQNTRKDCPKMKATSNFPFMRGVEEHFRQRGNTTFLLEAAIQSKCQVNLVFPTHKSSLNAQNALKSLKGTLRLAGYPTHNRIQFHVYQEFLSGGYRDCEGVVAYDVSCFT